MQKRFQTFTLLNAQISRQIRRIKSEEMADFELKSGHVSCLYYLHKFGSLTAKELCDVCEEDKANLSRSIEYLEENGYLTTPPEGKNRYKRRYTLTEKGLEVAERLDEKIDSVLAVAGEGVKEEDRAIMYACLSKISANLQRICDEYDK
ncbi:MAG: winged helix-turn-helix transcriptional regulator [Clostridia bacterium]|nr:winged helix-turn-helix transcriptional regulator [Clostridia bacterium]